MTVTERERERLLKKIRQAGVTVPPGARFGQVRAGHAAHAADPAAWYGDWVWFLTDAAGMPLDPQVGSLHPRAELRGVIAVRRDADTGSWLVEPVADEPKTPSMPDGRPVLEVVPVDLEWFWEGLPDQLPRSYLSLQHAKVAAMLRARPGIYAKPKNWSAGYAYAAAIRSGRIAAYRPAGSFDARVVNGELYVRYVGLWGEHA